MNSSIFADDIRRRTIRVERDKILNQMRREEEMENMSIPKRFIHEAEERARDRINARRWRGWFALFLLIAVGVFVGFKYFRTLKTRPANIKREIMIQTETPKTVSFREDTPNALKKEFPDTHDEFVRNHSPEWLVSNLSGKMQFDYYHEEERKAVDLVPGDFYVFPNSLTDDEIRFQNMIYDKKVKKELCEERGIDYIELDLT
jgi:hypothetical protein